MSKRKYVKKLHPEDRKVIVSFIDYVRVNKSNPENVRLEIAARYVCEYVKVNPNQSNARVANALARKLETVYA